MMVEFAISTHLPTPKEKHHRHLIEKYLFEDVKEKRISSAHRLI